MGQGLCFGQLWLKGEAWWDGEPCSSGIDILQFSVGLTARESLGHSPPGERAVKAVEAGTCHTLERSSEGS